MSTEAISQIGRFFSLLADEQWDAAREMMSERFVAFENGAFYAPDAFLHMIRSVFSTGARYRWYLTDFLVQPRGDDIAIAYRNAAKIHLPDKCPEAKQWREIVVLAHGTDGWKIDFLWSVPANDTPGV